MGLTAILFFLSAFLAFAPDGVWVGLGAQAFGQAIWGGVANWTGSTVASGSGFTAYFTNTFNNGYNCTVNTARTIGNIWFTDPANATDFTLVKHASDFTLTLAVSSGSPVINVTQAARTLTIQPIVAGSAGLTKIGPGTLVLTNANIYTGSTVVSNGTLRLWTATYATTAVFANDGTTIGALVTATDAQLSIPGAWTNAANSTLIIDYGTNVPSSTVAPISVTDLSLGTNVTLQVKGTSFLTIGQPFPLITWTGTGPANPSAFATLIPPAGVNGSFSVAGNTLYYTATSLRGSLTWNTGNGNWDTTSANWLDVNLTPTAFIDTVDYVVFDDASGATGNPIVTLNSSLSPSSVTMTSTNHSYTLSGSGGIAGAGSLTLDAANTQTLTLATTNTYSGDTIIHAGTLKLGAANVLPVGTGKGNFTVNAGGILDLNTFSVAINSLNGAGVVDTVAGGSPDLAVGANNANSGFSGVLQNTAGTLNLVKNGSGQLSLLSANTFTGKVTVNRGTLSFADPNALSTVSEIVLGNGASLVPNLTPDAGMSPAVDVVINAPITLGASGTTATIAGNKLASAVDQVVRMSLNGPITGDGNLTFLGVNVGAGAATTLLNAQNTYAGNTLISCEVNGNAGLNMYVQLGTNNALPPTTVLTLDGLASVGRTVALDLNGFNQTLAGLANVPQNNRLQRILNSSGTPAILTVNNASNYIFSGEVGILGSDNFGLTKNGTGTLTLASTNSYTGPTVINNGILQIGSGGQLGEISYSGNISIAGGAALLFTSTNSTTLSGAISGSGGFTNAGSGVVTVSGSVSLPNVTVGTSGTLALSGGSVNAIAVNSGGALNLPAGGTATSLVFDGAGTMNFDVASGGQLTVVANNGVANNGAAGSITINITGATPGDGNFTLIAYSGSLQGSGFSAYQLGSVPSGKTYKLVNTGSAVQLSVTSVLTWSGAQSSEWSINPIAGSKNWLLAGSAADYTDGVNVLFNDTVGAGSTTVDISVADVTPATPAGFAAAASVGFDNTNYNYTLQGSKAIAGAASLRKDGNGTLTVLNNNTYTGGTTINGGIVQIGNGGTTGALGPGAITHNGDLQFNRSDAVFLANPISGTGSLTQNGTGTLALSGGNNYTGATTVNAGTLNLTGTNTGSSVTVNNNGVLQQSPTGVIAGSGVTFTHASSATSTLAGPNTFTGAIGVNSGELNLSNWSTNTLGAVTVAGLPEAILGITGSATFNLGANSLFVGTAAGGNGTVNQTGGKVTFTSGNAVLLGNGAGSGSSGTYNLSGGTLTSFSSTTRGVILGVNMSCPGTFNLSGTGNLGLTNANLQIGRSDSAAGSSVCLFNQTGGTATVGTLTIGGNLTTSSGNNSTLSLTAGTFAASSFTRLALGNDDVVTITIGGSAQVTLPAFPTARGANASATITFDSVTGFLSPAAASANYMPDGSFNNQAYLTTNGANFNVASGRNITIGQLLENAPSHAGTLTKSGVGSLTLTNANTYTGGTKVNAGTLQVGNPTGSGTGTGTVTVNSGGTLGGTGTVGGAVIVNGTVSAGTSVGTLTTGSQTWNGGATNRFELASATNSTGRDLININGTLDVQATAGSKFTLRLISMANNNSAGLVPDFNGNTAYSWVIATVSGGILNFDAGKFAIDTRSFSNAFSGAFSVAVQGNSLVVNYIAPPAILSFGPLSGTSFPLTFSGPSGQTYSVLTSTNVALPLGSWTVLGAGTFGAGQVIFTDTAATNAQQFYRIQLP